ncbi:MAG TPA: flippase [Chitinophaga sp.]|nr:flippase [Chitinophaga sp.]
MYKIFKNSGWLLADKLARLFLGLITMAMIARHIGPELFGIWNFAIALTTIAGSFSVLGLDKVVVKEVVSYPERQDRIIASALAMRLAAGFMALVLCIGIVTVMKQNATVYLYCTAITAINIMLQSFEVFDYYYQAKNEVQKVIIPRVTVFIFFCLLKMTAVYMNGTLLTFLWLTLVELLFTCLVILFRYLENGRALFRAVSGAEMKYLFLHSWPLMFTGVLVLLYMKSDQLMLDTFGSSVQLGEYAAAARISELWYAIPTVIATALLPGLIRKRDEHKEEYRQAIERWLRLSFWLSIVIAMSISFMAGRLTAMMYGAQYPQSGLILAIHIWANIPVFLCVAIMQYLIVEGAYNINLYATIAGIIVNLTVNLLLIPHTGGAGAAIATVVSYLAVCSTLIVLDRTGQVRFFMLRMLMLSRALQDARQVLDALRNYTENLLSVIREKSLTK